RLVIDRVYVNVFARFPAGSAKYHWLIRLVIVLVSPDLGRVKERLAQEQVVTVHAAGDQDFLVAGKCDGALAASRQDAAAGNGRFIKRGEIRFGGNSVRIVKPRHIGPEHENLPVGKKRRTGCMEIQAS